MGAMSVAAGPRTCTGECCWRFPLVGDQSGRHKEIPEGLDPICYEIFHVTETPYYFGCRAWDHQTWECEVYDRRPALCRRYPIDGRPCPYCGAMSSEEATDPPMIGLA